MFVDLVMTFPLLYLSPYLTFSSNPSCISSNGGGDSFMSFYPHCRANNPRSPHHHLQILGPWDSHLPYFQSSLATRCTKYSPLLLLSFFQIQSFNQVRFQIISSMFLQAPLDWSIWIKVPGPQIALHIMTETQVKSVRNLFPVRAREFFPPDSFNGLYDSFTFCPYAPPPCLALTLSRVP